MAHNATEQPGTMRWGVAGVCLLLAVFFLGQLLGLFFIERIAHRAVDSGKEVTGPLSVRFVALVAEKLHEEDVTSRLKPDGSNWPFAFRMFYALELCGLAGLCIAFFQLAASTLKQRRDWMTQAVSILIGSCLAMLVGGLFLRLIR